MTHAGVGAARIGLEAGVVSGCKEKVQGGGKGEGVYYEKVLHSYVAEFRWDGPVSAARMAPAVSVKRHAHSSSLLAMVSYSR